jgi:hypothetical protein
MQRMLGPFPAQQTKTLLGDKQRLIGIFWNPKQTGRTLSVIAFVLVSISVIRPPILSQPTPSIFGPP